MPLTVAGVAILVAAASAGVVIGHTRENRLAAERLQAAGNDADADAIDAALARAGHRVPPAALANSAAIGAGVVPATLREDWAGPVTEDELQRERRRLSAEERNSLRQDIRSASKEVYRPYQPEKP